MFKSLKRKNNNGQLFNAEQSLKCPDFKDPIGQRIQNIETLIISSSPKCFLFSKPNKQKWSLDHNKISTLLHTHIFGQQVEQIFSISKKLFHATHLLSHLYFINENARVKVKTEVCGTQNKAL